MQFKAKQFDLNLSTMTYVQEASTLGIPSAPRTVELVDDQGKELKFVFDRIDWADASHEDIAGWRFKTAGYPDWATGLLIIND